jgi:hypothetical protein
LTPVRVPGHEAVRERWIDSISVPQGLHFTAGCIDGAKPAKRELEIVARHLLGPKTQTFEHHAQR